MVQAKNYAGKLAVRFTYSANGQGIYGIDMKEGTEGEVPRLPDAGRTVAGIDTSARFVAEIEKQGHVE